MPPITSRFLSLWTINGPLEQSRLRQQMDEFRRSGLDGVVFHPRFYPNEPPYPSDDYLAEVSAAILYAKSLGLAFWLYDEDGWPSGTVGGQLLRQFPGDAQRWVAPVGERPTESLLAFEYAGQPWHLEDRRGAGVDYLNPEFTRHFLELTYERYRANLAPEAFEYVEAFFT